MVKGMHSSDFDSITVEASLMLLEQVARRYGTAAYSYCNRAKVDYTVARLLRVPSSHLERKNSYEVGFSRPFFVFSCLFFLFLFPLFCSLSSFPVCL